MSARVADAIETVLFDLDGTLVDSLPGIEFSLNEAVRAVLPGTPLPPAQSLIGPPVREMFRLALPDADEATLGELQCAFRRSYDAEGYRQTRVYPGAAGVLEALTRRGVCCCLVTNKPPEATRRVLAHLALDGYLHRVVSTGDWLPEIVVKAEATRRMMIAERLDPARCAFVGDSPDDADAARTNGITFFAATYGYGVVRALPGESALAALADLTTLIHTNISGAAR